MFTKLCIFLSVACAAFFIARPAGAAAVDAEKYGHEQARAIHPCGHSGRQLSNLTRFFVHRWRATYVDLEPILLVRWLEFHDLLDADPPIVLARVYSSPHQPLLAVVAAYQFENYLDGQVLVSVHCIAPVNEQHLLRQYEPEALEAILGTPGDDA